jgi:hypothetical protein
MEMSEMTTMRRTMRRASLKMIRMGRGKGVKGD